MELKLKQGWNSRPGNWGTILVGHTAVGVRVMYDQPGGRVLLYGLHGVFLDDLPAPPGNWERVAHAYFVANKLQSPWEECKV